MRPVALERVCRRKGSGGLEGMEGSTLRVFSMGRGRGGIGVATIVLMTATEEASRSLER